MIFHKAALGGTFDRLHIGHETLLATALQLADNVVVGITRPSLNQHKTYASLIQDYSIRHQAVFDWLSARKMPNQQIEIMPIDDIYGPTLTDRDIDVLVVTSQTRAGADLINQKRLARDLGQLPIIEVPLIKDDVGIHVSSTRIRAGRISRTGIVFDRLLAKDFTFTTTQLHHLASPQGKIVAESDLSTSFLNDFTNIAVVGDIVTQTFLRHQLTFTYAIIDGKTQRQAQVSIHQSVTKLQAENIPGTINAHIAQAIIQTENLNESHRIYSVGGEEDLLAFVPVLTLPLNSVVFYGQPQQGIGMIIINEAVKLHYARFIDPNIT